MENDSAQGEELPQAMENIDLRVEKNKEISTKNAKKMIILKLEATDGTIVEVEEDVANVSLTLRGMIENLNIKDSEDHRLKDAIPVDLSGEMLKKVMEFCTHYRDIDYIPKNQRDTNQVPLDDWDKNYLDISSPLFQQLFDAATYMDVPGLMEIQAQLVANTLESYDVDQLREAFGVQNDFTPQETEELKQKYAWAETWKNK